VQRTLNPSKDPHISWKKSPVYYEKSPVFHGKSHIFDEKRPAPGDLSPLPLGESDILEKSPIFHGKRDCYSMERAIYSVERDLRLENCCRVFLALRFRALRDSTQNKS